MPTWNNVDGKVVCGKLHKGGTAKKKGTYRLAKGEKVYTPAQLKKMGGGSAPKGHSKKCSCKKH